MIRICKRVLLMESFCTLSPCALSETKNFIFIRKDFFSIKCYKITNLVGSKTSFNKDRVDSLESSSWDSSDISQ